MTTFAIGSSVWFRGRVAVVTSSRIGFKVPPMLCPNGQSVTEVSYSLDVLPQGKKRGYGATCWHSDLTEQGSKSP